MNKAIMWDGDHRYLVARDGQTVRPELVLVRVVDVLEKMVSPEISIGSVLAQEEPDFWIDGPGPDAALAESFA